MRDQKTKADAGKLRMELIPPEAYISLAKALTHGANKHGVGNWKQVSKDRFQGAMIRHYTAYMLDNQSVDEDTGLKHSELMLCNAMFLSWFETSKNKASVNSKDIILNQIVWVYKIKDGEIRQSIVKKIDTDCGRVDYICQDAKDKEKYYDSFYKGSYIIFFNQQEAETFQIKNKNLKSEENNEKNKYKVGDCVRFKVDKDVCAYGHITEVIKDNLYEVKTNNSTADDWLYYEIDSDDIIKERRN